MILSAINKLLISIIFISGICSSSVYTSQVNFWDLSPQNSVEVEEKIVHAYSAQVLMSRNTQTNVEVLLQIKDAKNEQKFAQAWIIGDLNQPKYSMGERVLLLIDPLNTEKCIVDGNHNFETQWSYKEGANWIIHDGQTPESSLTLKGIDYLIYPGEIVNLNYSTKIDYHYRAEHDGLEHQLEIDIGIIGSEAKHYKDNRKLSTDLRYPEMGLDDIFIKKLRFWNLSDQIKILVNGNFPGFWWIFNESRNEAIFVAQGHPIEYTTDLWSRLGD